MLQIWILFDFYFLVCAYIVAKPYVLMYGCLLYTSDAADE